jgi:mono/diheme cytochrome c family protein/ketosteroid isomerase-like protein
MKRTLSTVVITLLAVVLMGALVVVSGALSVAADEPHSSLVLGILDSARERSIEARADSVQVPALDDAARMRRGAGNYDSMCARCHLAPGMDPTELSVGLSPIPPNLAKHAHADPAEAFWVIKHGIKSTGMPAWGKHMEDQYIWDIVAFVRKLPSLSAEQYQAEVTASGGHSPASGPVGAAEALHDAMSAGDAARVQSLLDPEVMIMEGGNVERSLSEYAAHHLPADLKFMKGLTYRLERQTGDSSGDLAWVANEAALTGSSGGKPVTLVSTETLVLKNVGGSWKVVHIHWSSRDAKGR